MIRRSLITVATALSLLVVPGFTSPAFATPEGIPEQTSGVSPGGIPETVLAEAASKANPIPEPTPLSYGITAADKTVDVQPVAVAAAPSPSSSSSAPRPPKPADEWWRTNQTTSNFFPASQGFMRFAKTPAAAIGPNGQQTGWESRQPSNYPSTNWNNSGTGLCRGDSEGRTISSPYPVSDSVCWQTNTSTSSDMVCYFAPYGSLQRDPYANYAWGINWSIVAKHYLRERYTWIWNGNSNSWIRTRTGELRDFGDISFKDYKVTWGNCATSTAPYNTTKKCVKDILRVGLDGPYGEGLPAKNYFDGRTIPESVRKFQWLLRPNGSSPLNRIWNGGKLAGYGQNSQSLNTVATCNDWTPSISPAPMNFLGNWQVQQEATWSICNIIVYPQFGQRNFQGCNPPTTEMSYFNYVVTCSKTNPAADYVVAPRSSPDMRTNFSPEAQECYRVQCEWTNDPESNLPTRTMGQDNGIAVVTNEKNPRVVLRPGQKTGTIQVPADGSSNSIRYPRLKMDVLGRQSFTPQAVGEKWAVFEVKRGSSPWYIRNGQRNTNPNNEYQPFQSETQGRKGILSVNRNPSNSLPYCLPGHDACLQRSDITSLAGPEGTPIVGSTWPRTLKMDFYRPVYPAPAAQEFSVRGLYHQSWTQRIATPSMTSINPVTGARSWSGSARNYTVTATCGTDWTDLQALSSRPSP